MVSENCYRLTSPSNPHETGAIWGDYTIDLRNYFEIRFSVNLGCGRSVGEGVAFVLHTNRAGVQSLGCGGAGLGFGNTGSAGCVGISPSLALEIDAKHSIGQSIKEPFRPHLALVQDGDVARPLTEPVPLLDNGVNAIDCDYHEVQLTWTPSKGELQVFFDGNLRMTYKGNIAETVFGNSNQIYFGITGSTGAQATMQMVCVQAVVLEIDEVFERRRAFEQGVGIYTNPIREKLTIDVQFDQNEYLQLQLFDSAGKMIYEVPPHLVRENQYQFNLPGLPSGVYYVTVTNGTDRVSKRIVHVSSMRA